MTPEDGYLILSVLAAWFAAIVAYISLVLDRRDRKAQLNLMNETIETFTKAVKSYEKSIKRARKTKVDPSFKAEVERQKTLREQARLEKVKRTTELIKAGGKLLGKK